MGIEAVSGPAAAVCAHSATLQNGNTHGSKQEEVDKTFEDAVTAIRRAAIQTNSLPHSEQPAVDDIDGLIHNSPFLDLDSPITAYEWFKLVLLLPVAMAKFIATIAVFTVGWAVCGVLSYGAKPNKPLPAWKEAIIRPFLRLLASLLLWINCFWVNVRGWENVAKAKTAHAQLLVFNHVSYMDSIALVALFAPSGVAKAGVAELPFVGVVAKALQFLFVRRRGTRDAANSHVVAGSTTKLIAERAADPRWPFLMIAPEATTKFGHCLLRFSTGAFVPGLPVMPVLLKYRHRHFNPGWGICNTKLHLLRLLTQFVNFLDVEVLEPYTPSEAERADPQLYAANVRKLMAERLGVPLVENSITHEHLLLEAGVTLNNFWTAVEMVVPPTEQTKSKAA